MADQVQVRSVMSTMVQMGAEATFDQARTALKENNAEFAIINGTDGKIVDVLSADQLRLISGTSQMKTIVANPRLIVVEPNMLLTTIVQMLAQDLVLNRKLAGFVVEAGGTVLGVLSRKTIVEHAAKLATRGSEALAGNPVGDIPLYECPIDHERRLIPYYDPQNPPKCSAGHPMNLIDE